MMKDIEQILNLLGVAVSKSGHNNTGHFLGVKCPYCSDASDHGGFNRVTGSFHCVRCQQSNKFLTAISDILGIQVKDIVNRLI